LKPLFSTEIFGNWATIFTPYDKNSNVDFAALANQIDILIESRPNGIYSNGTAGEFFTQTEEEFLQVSTMLAEKCSNSGTPFQIGVSHMSAQISLQRLRAVKDLKPGAVQVILPDWYPPTLEESIDFLKRIEENADGIPLVLYNPPHAKVILTPDQWAAVKSAVPTLVGVKVADNNRDQMWYEQVRKYAHGLSVFVPGHNLATGMTLGGHGAYSNMSCVNPFAAQRWYELMKVDRDASLEIESRIHRFFQTSILPLISEKGYSGFACDRFLMTVGGWAPIEGKVRWPYRSIPEGAVFEARKSAKSIIPEFFY